MGPSLFQLFLDDQVCDIQRSLTRIGVHGLLSAFEDWLRVNCLFASDVDARASKRFSEGRSISTDPKSPGYSGPHDPNANGDTP